MARQWSQAQQAIFAWFRKDQPALLEFSGLEIDENGNLVVRARAGTGKTTVIIEGVKQAPERAILMAAFSKIIQLELEARFRKDSDGNDEVRATNHIKAQTLHSVGYACVRKFRERIQVDFGSTRADMLTEQVCGRVAPDTIKRLVSKLHTKGREIAPHAKQLGDLTDIAIRFECEPDENWQNSGFPLEKVEQWALDCMELAANVKSGETIDGADMIFLPLRNGWLHPMYDLVVVDEAQDMTVAQLEIAQGVLRKGGRMCVVGDDRQAIFGFRGADSDSIDRLKVELNAAELPLTTTYRCGKQIVEVAQALVPDFNYGPNNPDGEILECHTSRLTEAVLPGDYVLSRLNAPLVSIAMKLLRSGKRTRIAGRDIGKGLTGLVKKMKARSVPEFLTKVANWEDRELNRLNKMLEGATLARQNTIRYKMSDVSDQAEMLATLADGAKSVNEIETRIMGLFEDDGLGVAGMVTCSSVHRAKGLEADRVFILEETLRDWNMEELNIKYVAVTRAKKTLVWVSTQVVEA
jgi:superfamily I DNA/RNA helicase